MYMYKSHTGGYYFNERELTEKELFCELCMDCDSLIGKADSFSEALKLVKEETSLFGGGRRTLKAVYPAIASAFRDETEKAGEEVPTVDGYGFCGLTDAEILEKIRKITGIEPVLFEFSCPEKSGFVKAPTEEEARSTVLGFCRCRRWKACEGPNLQRISMAEFKEKESEWE